jgi:hypothetical protein
MALIGTSSLWHSEARRNNPDRTWPSVVTPLNGSFHFLSQLSPHSLIKGSLHRFSAHWYASDTASSLLLVVFFGGIYCRKLILRRLQDLIAVWLARKQVRLILIFLQRLCADSWSTYVLRRIKWTKFWDDFIEECGNNNGISEIGLVRIPVRLLGPGDH